LAKILRREKVFPRALANLLADPSIIKLGVQVQGDLTRVANQASSVRSNIPTTAGALDLAVLARELGVGSTTKVSLEALCASLLDRNLAKPETVRISALWEEDTLSDAQINYAAADAAVALEIYTAMMQQSALAGSRVPRHLLLPGTSILLYQADLTTRLARGRIHCLSDAAHEEKIRIWNTLGPEHPKLTKPRMVVEIDRILLPGAFVPGYGRTRGGVVHERSIDSLQPNEGRFLLVVPQELVRMDNPVEVNRALDNLEAGSFSSDNSLASRYTAAEKGKGKAPEANELENLELPFSHGEFRFTLLSRAHSHSYRYRIMSLPFYKVRSHILPRTVISKTKPETASSTATKATSTLQIDTSTKISTTTISREFKLMKKLNRLVEPLSQICLRLLLKLLPTFTSRSHEFF
jgi:hypothetical protein